MYVLLRPWDYKYGFNYICLEEDKPKSRRNLKEANGKGKNHNTTAIALPLKARPVGIVNKRGNIQILDTLQSFTDAGETFLWASTLYDAPAHSNGLSHRSTSRITWALSELQGSIKAYTYKHPNHPNAAIHWRDTAFKATSTALPLSSVVATASQSSSRS
ncbi:hypothetical protein TNCV_3016191 [Trichonephila clavipes]|nr:hypothetical protein TNCV_3016191 [Trichonephila clavipes]